jgi:uncharacterized protein (TIGR04255 family)
LASGPGLEADPHYKLLPGRFFDRLQQEYPEHEQLPAASVPDEMLGHLVQHRFRVAAGDWPLIQLGPGILTVNDTAKYIWPDFRTRALAACKTLYDAYPKSNELKIESLVLRYIDAVDFDYANEDAFMFLREKMRVNIALPTDLFEHPVVTRTPKHFTWQTMFECREPSGVVQLRFATGLRHDKPVLIWETTVQSANDAVPQMPEGFESWLGAAHKITGDWFFKLIDGELKRRFAGE